MIGYAVVESQWNRGTRPRRQALVTKAREASEVRRIVAHTPLERPEERRVLERRASRWCERSMMRTRTERCARQGWSWRSHRGPARPSSPAAANRRILTRTVCWSAWRQRVITSTRYAPTGLRSKAPRATTAPARSWVSLRRCLTCGHVGCCDSSPGLHATAHHKETGHPMVETLQPGQDWGVVLRRRGGRAAGRRRLGRSSTCSSKRASPTCTTTSTPAATPTQTRTSSTEGIPARAVDRRDAAP